MDFEAYGFYIWGAYAVTAIGFISLIALSILDYRKQKTLLKDLKK